MKNTLKGCSNLQFKSQFFVYKILYYFEGISQRNFTQKELTSSDVEDMNKLSVLQFLVIDDYDTTQLSKRATSNIESWVNSGGIPIIGTGPAMDKTFCKFDQNMIDITMGNGGVASVPSYYGNYNNQTGDNENLDCADLEYGSSYSYNVQSFDLWNTFNFYDWPQKSCGRGTVCVYPFALGDSKLSTDYIISQCENPIIYNNNSNYGLWCQASLSPINHQCLQTRVFGEAKFRSIKQDLLLSSSMTEDVWPSCSPLESLTAVSLGKAWHFQADI